MEKPNASSTGDKLTEEQQAVADMEALRKAGVIR